MQVCLLKIGVRLLVELTICIDNAGPLQNAHFRTFFIHLLIFALLLAQMVYRDCIRFECFTSKKVFYYVHIKRLITKSKDYELLCGLILDIQKMSFGIIAEVLGTSTSSEIFSVINNDYSKNFCSLIVEIFKGLIVRTTRSWTRDF